MKQKEKNKEATEPTKAAAGATPVSPEEVAEAATATEVAEAVPAPVAEVPAGESAGEETTLPLAAAWGKFLAALSPRERETVLGALTRLAEGERARRESEAVATCLAEMEKSPAFAGILSRRDAITDLISRVGWLQALPMRDRLAAACYLDRGMRLHEPTAEEKLEAILADPALMRALAERQATLRGAQKQTVAPGVRAGGRMPANLPKPPKTLREAGQAAKQYFNL